MNICGSYFLHLSFMTTAKCAIMSQKMARFDFSSGPSSVPPCLDFRDEAVHKLILASFCRHALPSRTGRAVLKDRGWDFAWMQRRKDAV